VGHVRGRQLVGLLVQELLVPVVLVQVCMAQFLTVRPVTRAVRTVVPESLQSVHCVRQQTPQQVTRSRSLLRLSLSVSVRTGTTWTQLMSLSARHVMQTA
jgi:hypothetical protein